MQQPGNWFGTATLYIAFALALFWTLSTLSQVENLVPDHEVVYASQLLMHIPPNSTNDAYHVVSVKLDGQSVPLNIYTSTGDSFVASGQCDVSDPKSGCYALDAVFNIDENTMIHHGQKFEADLGGAGRATGQLATLRANISGLEVGNVSAALIDNAMPGSFQNGTFAGILGLGMRTASTQWLQFQKLPLVDTLITQGKLAKPLFSLRFPRLGDPNAMAGVLSLGEIEPEFMVKPIKYSDVVQFSSSLDNVDSLSTAAWAVSLDGLRMNGVEVPVSPGRLRPDTKHVSVIDSGSSNIYLPTSDFKAVVEKFEGKTEVRQSTSQGSTGDEVYFECAEPQSLELKVNGNWYLVDPLDMLVSHSSNSTENGTMMCRGGIGSVDSPKIGDSVLGMPFLRSVFTIYDYMSTDMFSKSPRLGLLSLVDTRLAKSRYADLYTNRLP
ncbi:aspartic peptidase domain-containing protein [Apiospora saccharicola]|uniref:Aspartic peptidase domain-containing protein n=1 Tax=Apiospora saccharicola TaxID=335842 RepID=A0ABR1UXW0_9PEZI